MTLHFSCLFLIPTVVTETHAYAITEQNAQAS